MHSLFSKRLMAIFTMMLFKISFLIFSIMFNLILVKPLTTTITGNNNIIANGITTLTLDCTSGSSNPISDITWAINNAITQATQNLSNQSGEYGGIKRRQRLILTPTRDDDGDIISCEAKNSLGSSYKNEETLDLRCKFVYKV
jgi:hypothetical protein